MKTAEKKGLQIRMASCDPALRREIQRALVHGSGCEVPWSRMKIRTPVLKQNFLLVVEVGTLDVNQGVQILQGFRHLFFSTPLVYISANHRQSNESPDMLTRLFEEFGAKVFFGESGKDALLKYMSRISEADPAGIITSLGLTDAGLTAVFADKAVARISFQELKRMAETDEIMWSDVRIAGDRSYITIGTANGPVPIPHDILREFVRTGKPERLNKNRQQRILTAKSLGERVRALRKRAGTTQNALAAKSGTSRWTIMRIERGSYLPKVSLLESITRVLDLELGELLP